MKVHIRIKLKLWETLACGSLNASEYWKGVSTNNKR